MGHHGKCKGGGGRVTPVTRALQNECVTEHVPTQMNAKTEILEYLALPLLLHYTRRIAGMGQWVWIRDKTAVGPTIALPCYGATHAYWAPLIRLICPLSIVFLLASYARNANPK